MPVRQSSEEPASFDITDMNKVLFVSYVFPPMAAVGSQRVVNFCRFLPEYDWQPVVLTVKKGHNTSWDPTMLEKIPDTIVYRSTVWEPYLWLSSRNQPKPQPVTKSKQPSSSEQTQPSKPSVLRRIKRFITLFMRVPDEIIFWVPFAVIKGIRVVKKEKIEAIVSTSPPVTSHICASLISRFTGVPHIVDFRDLWTLNHTYHQRHYPPFFEKYDRWWEKLVLNHAADIFTASPGFTRLLQKHLNRDIEIKTITNGFDYTEIDRDHIFDSNKSGRMNIIYTGSIYSDFNPEFFFACLSEWMIDNKISQDKLSVDFYGNCGFDYTNWLKELKLDKVVTFHGFVSRQELPGKIESSDYLLLLLGFKDEYKNVIPAKLFDYLATGIPIIAIAPDGVTVDLIRKYRAGSWQCTPDKESMKQLLTRLYKDWQYRPVEEKKYRYIDEIDRNYLTGKLAEILENNKANR